MRLLHFYLAAYAAVLLAALVSLWTTGVLQRLSPLWILFSLVVAIGFGVLLYITSRRSVVPTD
jgi:hypothetical protein